MRIYAPTNIFGGIVSIHYMVSPHKFFIVRTQLHEYFKLIIVGFRVSTKYTLVDDHICDIIFSHLILTLKTMYVKPSCDTAKPNSRHIKITNRLLDL